MKAYDCILNIEMSDIRLIIFKELKFRLKNKSSTKNHNERVNKPESVRALQT